MLVRVLLSDYNLVSCRPQPTDFEFDELECMFETLNMYILNVPWDAMLEAPSIIDSLSFSGALAQVKNQA